MSGGTSEQKTTLPKLLKQAFNKLSAWVAMSQVWLCSILRPRCRSVQPNARSCIQGTDVMAGAFVMTTTSCQQYMPAPTQFEGGAMGYSSAPLFEQSVGLLREARPGQAEYLESFSIDPITGQTGSRSPRQQPVALEMQQAAKRGK